MTPSNDETDSSPAIRTLAFDAPGVPAHVCVLWPDEASARACPRGDMELTYDSSIGRLSNTAFDARCIEYAEGYENSLSFSEFFQGYLEGLAEDLAARHDLAGKRVIEIGSGDGEFISSICRLSGAEGIGYEPSWAVDREASLEGGKVQVVRGFFPPEGEPAPQAALVVCRQVLEHIEKPEPFLEAVRAATAPGSTVVFEVPNARDTLNRCSWFDLIYEHVHVFTAGSLARQLAKAGFQVTRAQETYSGQFVLVEAVVPESGPGSVPPEFESTRTLTKEVEAFASEWPQRRKKWMDELNELGKQGKRISIWGSGARGVNFLNLADPNGHIQGAVDLNPRKHGRHVAGSGQCVQPPEWLKTFQPDLVIVMNPNYEDEIKAALADLGLKPEVRLA